VLLRHLWATDGSIVVPSPSAKSAPRIYFSTSSRGLAEDVAALLLRFSIVARIRRTDVDGYRPCYSVDVSGTPDQKRFLKAVGAFGPRVRQAAQLRELISGTKPNTNVDTLPQETFDQVLRRMAELGISGRDMASLRGTAHAGSAHFQFAPSRTLLAEYAEILDDEDLRRQATSDLFWDRVVEISPAGEEEVFDLTVPGPSSWLADSIVSHNSGALEQDSDVVMFIHRDEMYSDDPALKGLAEVKVAKHRNGPIDTIKLTFISQLTQFQNYARPQ
jgi:replicative DNA helicase